MVAQQLGEPVSAPGVHQVGQELDISGSELLLALHVDIGEVTLANLQGMHDLKLVTVLLLCTALRKFSFICKNTKVSVRCSSDIARPTVFDLL